MLVIGVLSFFYLTTATKRSEEMYNDHLLRVKKINEMRADSRAIQALLLKMIITEDQGERDKVKAGIDQYVASMNQGLDEYGKQNLRPYEQEIFTNLMDKMKNYDSYRNNILNLATLGKKEDALTIYDLNETRLNLINNQLESLANFNAEQADLINRKNAKEEQASMFGIILCTVVGLLIITLMGLYISVLIANPLRAVMTDLKEIAKGNLAFTRRIFRTKDEMGELSLAVNEMADYLQELLLKAKMTTETVASSAHQFVLMSHETSKITESVTHSMQEVAAGAEAQVVQADESRNNILEMVQGIERIAESSSVVADLSVATAKDAEQSNTAMHKMIRQMESLQASVLNSAEAIRILGDKSHDIESIVQVITEIAEQTNLLALNAAIEAARAGELGRGFAVVADEVRKLAEQSSNSAKQIAHLVSEIRNNTTNAVEAMEKGTAEAQTSMEMMSLCLAAFERIKSSSQNVSHQIQEITASVEELLATSESVARGIEQMAEIAKESAGNHQSVAAASQEQLATIEEIRASADHLKRVAGELEEVIAMFTLSEERSK
jgi:methyl-accepting chemotaxis protein